MFSDVIENQDFTGSLEDKFAVERSLYNRIMKTAVWVIGIPAWLFGVADRGVAAFFDHSVTTSEVSQLLFVSIIFVSWLLLKPEETASVSNLRALRNHNVFSSIPQPQEKDKSKTQRRMQELSDQFITSQEHTLPFPYYCQIYHLLNLKHLEDIHSFSLGNLKIVEVSEFQATQEGGKLKFKTLLDSPMNILRLWRDATVEVELTLHNPYTVELRIPAYAGKEVSVIFNAMPIDESSHKLYIDMYSDLGWPKPLLRFVFHMAAILTLLEDLPYLRKLAERNIQHLINKQRVSRHTSMQLFNRFIDLYGGSEAAMLQPHAQGV
ncbi:MAG: hypothetical protein ICV77_00295 [Cyanobacteria bacterium Co-bin8]|nr:hypothetical protein [Cyanobacteria bacterium Co-bin8]